MQRPHPTRKRGVGLLGRNRARSGCDANPSFRRGAARTAPQSACELSLHPRPDYKQVACKYGPKTSQIASFTGCCRWKSSDRSARSPATSSRLREPPLKAIRSLCRQSDRVGGNGPSRSRRGRRLAAEPRRPPRLAKGGVPGVRLGRTSRCAASRERAGGFAWRLLGWRAHPPDAANDRAIYERAAPPKRSGSIRPTGDAAELSGPDDSLEAGAGRERLPLDARGIWGEVAVAPAQYSIVGRATNTFNREGFQNSDSRLGMARFPGEP